MNREDVLKVRDDIQTMELHDNYEEMFNNASRALYAYTVHNPGIKSFIVGMSGGIDSAVTACVMHEAALRGGITTFGYCLPIMTNHPDETKRGQSVGSAMLQECSTVDLSKEFPTFVKMMDDDLYDAIWYTMLSEQPLYKRLRIRLGNLKARLRMMFLYDKAKKHDGIVISTDNLTEYLLGFWTLHGDVGDFGPIQNLYKTEVYGMANWLAKDSDRYMMDELLRPTIEAKPTDGLGVSNSDLDQLLPDWKGSYMDGYHSIDDVLIAWRTGRLKRDDSITIKRHLRTEFKRNNPYSPSREELLEEWS